jgi:hypothetical protein
MIGSGELIEGLYYLTTKAKLSPTNNHTTSACNTTHSSNIHIPSLALWHFRLGHLSNNRLLSMKHEFPFVTIDNHSICDICHLAKHRKLW